MKLALLVETSRRVTEASGRLEKVRLLAALLVTAPPEEIEVATAYLCGSPRQQRLGVGWATLRAVAGDLAANEDVKEFYLGLSGSGRKSYRDAKHYRRRKRWLA